MVILEQVMKAESNPFNVPSFRYERAFKNGLATFVHTLVMSIVAKLEVFVAVAIEPHERQR